MRLQVKRVKFVVLQQASRNVLGLFSIKPLYNGAAFWSMTGWQIAFQRIKPRAAARMNAALWTIVKNSLNLRY